MSVTDCQPLDRPGATNEVDSMGFVFDQITHSRSLKILGIVDDGTHEAVAAHAQHSVSGDHRARVGA